MSAAKLVSVMVLTVLICVNGNPYSQWKPSSLKPSNAQNGFQTGNKTGIGSRFEEFYRWKLISYTPLDNGM